MSWQEPQKPSQQYGYGQQPPQSQQYGYGQQSQQYGYGQQPPQQQQYSYGQQPPQQQQYSYGQQPPQQQQYSYGQQPPQQQQWQNNQPNPAKPLNATPVTGAPQRANPDEPIMGVPLYENSTGSLSKFVVTGYRDLWAAVLFGIALLITLGCAIYGGNTLKNSSKGSNSSDDNNRSVSNLKFWVPLGVVASLGIAAGSLIWMRAKARQFIIVSNIIICALNIVVAIYSFAQGAIWAGVLLLLCGVLGLVWLYMVRNRISFAAAVLSTSITVTTRHWGTFVASIVGLLAATVFTVMWIFAAAPVSAAYNDGGATDNQATWVYWASLALLLMMFWASQVFTNVVHVTSSGVVATWYFVGAANVPHNPTAASAKRALTTSFGSICFGSLVVAIIKLIYYIVKSAEDAARRDGENAFLLCMLRCIIGCIEQLFEYFNVYAFTHVAIYGTSYIESAKQTWEMIKTCGWSAYFNDCLVWPVFSVVTFFSSACIGIIFGLAAWDAIVGIICFLICYVIMVLMFRPVYSGIVTQFVCIAECPDVMLTTNPEYNQMMREAIAEMAGPVGAVQL